MGMLNTVKNHLADVSSKPFIIERGKKKINSVGNPVKHLQ